VDVLPANAEVTIDHAGLSACDAMPDGADPTKLLNVEMDQFARVFAFIASNLGLSRGFKKGQSGNPGGRPKKYSDFQELARQLAAGICPS
jgi:Family of unknown function (DUF5681)